MEAIKRIEKSVMGQLADGREVHRVTLTNSLGHRVHSMNWGASLLEVEVPDRQGDSANINLCLESLDRYTQPHSGFGSTIGRFCNRIGGASFTIDGETYRLTKNLGKNHIHGGLVNFKHLLWQVDAMLESDQEVGIRYRLVSPDGDEGFPGECCVTATYAWNDVNELTLTYAATTSKPTHVNLTNHSYWNLGGAGSGSAMDHVARIYATEVLDVDADLIPTGRLNSVEGTPLDFTKPTPFAARLSELAPTKGYDHCYVVAGQPGRLRPAARVVDPASGRVLEVETTQPGVQLYTANHLKGDVRSGGYDGHEAFCLETQHYPDAPNQPSFPSTLLRPGERMEEVTVFRLGVEG